MMVPSVRSQNPSVWWHLKNFSSRLIQLASVNVSCLFGVGGRGLEKEGAITVICHTVKIFVWHMWCIQHTRTHSRARTCSHTRRTAWRSSCRVAVTWQFYFHQVTCSLNCHVFKSLALNHWLAHRLIWGQTLCHTADRHHITHSHWQ